MDPFIPTPRTTLKRRSQRGSYDRQLIHAILDEALVCHVAFVDEGQPLVLPTAFARIGEQLYLHGAQGNRMLQVLAAGAACCVTVTLLDGLVLARSAMHHSMNYRSVVLLGSVREVEEEQEKRAAMEALVERALPGRMRDTRPPSSEELKSTRVVALELTEASAKVRSGPPVEDEADLTRPCWAGVLPLRLEAGKPQADSHCSDDIPLPEALRAYRRG